MSVVDWETFKGSPDLDTHVGFLLAEDAAMKNYLRGLSVPDGDGGSIDVPVWFRYPESERRIQYPFITIDFLTIQPDYTRWTSYHDMPYDSAQTWNFETRTKGTTNLYQPSVSPDLPFEVDDEVVGVHVDPFLMHTITYQVSTWSRTALHDRFLTSRFLTDVFPPRSFFLPVDADNTIRRAELLQMDPADTIETTESGTKRVFRKVYTVQVDAEIPQSQFVEMVRVGRIHIDLYPDIDGSREPSDHLYTDEHTLATPIDVTSD